MHKPRLALFGTPIYSVQVFDLLKKEGYPISVVITKSPRPVGRQNQITPTPVSYWAEKNQLPLLAYPSDLDKPWKFFDETQLTNQVLAYHPELLITADFTLKIPQSLIQNVKYRGLNLHPSLLPSYRGPAPIPWVILHGEKTTGVSIITLADSFDSGHLISQREVSISPDDTTELLLSKLFSLGAKLLLKTVPEYISSPDTQIKSFYLDSYFGKLTRDHGKEPWPLIKLAMVEGKDAERIDRKWRALHPWPGLWTEITVGQNYKRMKILKCRLNQDRGTTRLVLEDVQIEGKRPISFQSVKQIIADID